jgi:hypothetical protein
VRLHVEESPPMGCAGRLDVPSGYNKESNTVSRCSSIFERPVARSVEHIAKKGSNADKRCTANPAKRGRKPTWRDGFLKRARKLAALGLTDVEMAAVFGVSSRTLTRWKRSKPEFCLALKEGKDIADARVEGCLYERAVGYSVETEKIFFSGGKVIRVKTVEYYPPDTTACIFWLKNRQPGKWRDKVNPAQAAGQWNVIGLMPSEEE